ncbi:MAG: redox-sensing transcriptional repressor Rex [Myxococcales bacterium]|jgi:redox-sensing transcriptional repressor
MASERTIGRLSLYRRALLRLQAEEHRPFVYSHELAVLTGVSAAQVRRDLMSIGYSGSPNRGYDIGELVRSIGEQLDDPTGQGMAVVGVGNLGRAIINYVSRQRPCLQVAAAFDKDPEKAGRVIQGCRVYPLEQMPEIVREKRVQIGVISVPASAAQDAADRLVAAGVSGILNFAPASVRVPANVYSEDLDLITTLEKVAYFARAGKGSER